MTTRAHNATFKGAVSKLWNSLTARHRGENRERYGAVPIKRQEFEQWLWDKSNNGLTWTCEYTGNVLQLMAKTKAGRLSLDHRVPLSKGGTSTLNNFTICSEKANKVKGSLCVGFYRDLMRCMATWPEEEREEIMRRLAGAVPIYRRKR